MVLNRKNRPAVSSFKEEFNKLDDDTKGRVKRNIMSLLEISEDTFYRYLKTPGLMNKSERYTIAVDIFGMEVTQLFPSTR